MLKEVFAAEAHLGLKGVFIFGTAIAEGANDHGSETACLQSEDLVEFLRIEAFQRTLKSSNFNIMPIVKARA